MLYTIGKPGDAAAGVSILTANSTTSLPITVFTANNPSSIRTAYADRTDSAGLSIGWSTAGPLNSLPAILYGISTPPTQRASGATQSYPTSSQYHYVQIYGLQHSTVYYYQIQADSSGGSASDIYSIKTSHAAGDTTEHTMAMIGDFGLYNGEATHSALINNLAEYEYVVHIGDISYADDFFASAGETYEGIWDKW